VNATTKRVFFYFTYIIVKSETCESIALTKIFGGKGTDGKWNNKLNDGYAVFEASLWELLK
jgi:hypothetical protein